MHAQLLSGANVRDAIIELVLNVVDESDIDNLEDEVRQATHDALEALGLEGLTTEYDIRVRVTFQGYFDLSVSAPTREAAGERVTDGDFDDEINSMLESGRMEYIEITDHEVED